jgi:hypothetical protein
LAGKARIDQPLLTDLDFNQSGLAQPLKHDFPSLLVEPAEDVRLMATRRPLAQ